MTLRFLDPLGNELKLLNDTLNIKNVNFEYVSDSIRSIRIITNNFSKYEYKEGDTIIIKNFKFNDFNSSYDLRKIENYLNRDEGHKIILIQNFISDGFASSQV